MIMKRLVAVLALLLCFWFAGHAQELRFGFQASPTFTWLDSDDKFINSSGSNLGLKLGIRGEYFFAEKYAFFAGLGFGFNQGGTLLHDEGGIFWPESDLSSDDLRDLTGADDVKLKYSIRYVEVPFGLKLVTNEILRDFRFFFEVPITLGVRGPARGDILGTGAAMLNSEDEDIKKDVNVFNASWGLGLGAEYNIRGSSKGDTNLLLGISYNQGFLDVTNDKGAEKIFRDENDMIFDREDEDSVGTIRGITIMVGVMF